MTTTAVDEKKVPPEHQKHTNNKFVDRFNAISTPLAQRYNISIIDAHALSASQPFVSNFADGVHGGDNYFKHMAHIIIKHIHEMP